MHPQVFLFFLSTDYSNSTMSHAHIIPHISDPCQWTSPCRPIRPWIVSVIESHMAAHHYQWPHDAIKHWGACSALWLSFSWLSDPHKVAQQCWLTLALPLQGLLVISEGIPLHRLGYPQVFINPLPIPTKICAHRCGCRFWQVQAWVTLENPRVAHDIP